jgi:hypothetical protein
VVHFSGMPRVGWTGIAAAVLLAFVVAGCGIGRSGGSKPTVTTLSHTELVQKANSVCARAEPRVRHIKRPKTYKALVSQLKIATTVLEGLISGLRPLSPPPADAASFSRLLDNLDAEDLAAHNLLDAIESRDALRSTAVLKWINRLDRRLTSLFAELQLTACGYVAS